MGCCRVPLKAEKIAAELIRGLQQRFDRVPEYKDIDWPPHLSGSRWQQEFHTQLSLLGFSHLGDFEDANPGDVYGLKVVPVYRVLADPDGTTVVTLRQLNTGWAVRTLMAVIGAPRLVVAFRSAGVDGAVQATTNESPQPLPPMPDDIAFAFISPRTPLADMYQRHRQSLAHLARPLRRFRT